MKGKTIWIIVGIFIISTILYYCFKSSYYGVDMTVIDASKPVFEFRQYGISKQGLCSMHFETIDRTMLWDLNIINAPSSIQMTYGIVPDDAEQLQEPLDLPPEEIWVFVEGIFDVPIPVIATESYRIKKIEGQYVITKRTSGIFKPINLAGL